MNFRIVLVTLVMLTTRSAIAQSPSVNSFLQSGLACLASGDQRCAADAFGEGTREAIRLWDGGGLLALTGAYAMLGDEWNADQTLDLAVKAALLWAEPTAGYPASGSNPGLGLAVLRGVAQSTNLLASTPMSDAARRKLAWIAQSAATHAARIEAQRGTPSPTPNAPIRTQIGITISGGPCDLTGSFPTRGFGDSNTVDVWVPFRTSFGVPGPIRSAKLVIVVKPIGQLIGTDTLAIKGASGAARTVYSGFHSLPPNVWSTVEIPLNGDADVMAALASGHIEGLVQDDTAVHAMQLVLGF